MIDIRVYVVVERVWFACREDTAGVWHCARCGRGVVLRLDYPRSRMPARCAVCRAPVRVQYLRTPLFPVVLRWRDRAVVSWCADDFAP